MDYALIYNYDQLPNFTRSSGEVMQAGSLHHKFSHPGPEGEGKKRSIAYAITSYFPVAVKKNPFSTTGSETIRSQTDA